MLQTIFKPRHLNLWLFIAVACGIVLASWVNFFWVFLFLALAAVCAVFFFHKKNRFIASDISILFLFVSLGATLASASYQDPEALLERALTYEVAVTSLPQIQGPRHVFTATATACGIRLARPVRVVDYTRSMEFRATYKVLATLRARIYEGNSFYTLWIKSNASPISQPMNVVDRFNQKTALYVLDVFKKNVSEEGYRFLSSVFLGRRELFREGGRIFTDAGIAHLLAISGSNIALTGLVFFFIARMFYMPYRPAIITSLIFIIIYTVISGANLPTVRATLMYSIFTAGFFLQRKINPFNSLGLAGLVCLLLNPASLYDVGFQLSFLSVGSLIAGFKIFPFRATRFAFINGAAYTLFSSVYVSIVILPLVSHYFGRVYCAGILYNVILIPFFSGILIINFLLLIFSPFAPLAQAIGAVLSLLIYVFDILAARLGGLRFSFIDFTFPLWLVTVYYVLLIVFLWYWYRSPRHRQHGL
ncbi:MAG: ComEC/Rec2 family competence protein [Candidatus Omnitrophota bacterium]|nr:competence protein ComEC family protein [Candidatus Omnitrophota bacterium]